MVFLLWYRNALEEVLQDLIMKHDWLESRINELRSLNAMFFSLDDREASSFEYKMNINIRYELDGIIKRGKEDFQKSLKRFQDLKILLSVA